MKNYKVLIAALAPLVLGACEGLTGFAGEYSCPGKPGGVACMSARDVYAATNDRDALVSLDGEQGDVTAGDVQTAAVQSPPQAAFSAPSPLLDDGRIPLRTPARVMRIWVASFEDSHGDLHMPGLVFTEIQPRRWQVGQPHEAQRHTFQPLSN